MAKLNMLLFTAFMALLGMVFGDFCNGGVARTATVSSDSETVLLVHIF